MRILVAAVILASVARTQPPIWVTNPSNGHEYALSDPGSWAAAETQAVALGGHLVPPDTRVWIGLTDETVEGSWEWSSGEPFGYSHWGLFEPDNSGNQDHGSQESLKPTTNNGIVTRHSYLHDGAMGVGALLVTPSPRSPREEPHGAEAANNWFPTRFSTGRSRPRARQTSRSPSQPATRWGSPSTFRRLFSTRQPE